MSCTAEEVIGILGLKPLPDEGGYYFETFRDTRKFDDKRAACSAIYFLVKCNERTNWHRVDTPELWHWYAGAPLMLELTDAKGLRAIKLGSNLKSGERPQAIIPEKTWQRAESKGDWSLVGCTMAPAFEFSEFPPPNWQPQ
jgi:predicted cupin superfamily sugar epimerase